MQTLSSKSFGKHGFVQTSSAPAARARSISSFVAWPVRTSTMIFAVRGFDLISRVASHPSIRGIGECRLTIARLVNAKTRVLEVRRVQIAVVLDVIDDEDTFWRRATASCGFSFVIPNGTRRPRRPLRSRRGSKHVRHVRSLHGASLVGAVQRGVGSHPESVCSSAINRTGFAVSGRYPTGRGWRRTHRAT